MLNILLLLMKNGPLTIAVIIIGMCREDVLGFGTVLSLSLFTIMYTRHLLADANLNVW